MSRLSRNAFYVTSSRYVFTSRLVTFSPLYVVTLTHVTFVAGILQSHVVFGTYFREGLEDGMSLSTLHYERRVDVSIDSGTGGQGQRVKVRGSGDRGQGQGLGVRG